MTRRMRTGWAETASVLSKGHSSSRITAALSSSVELAWTISGPPDLGILTPDIPSTATPLGVEMTTGPLGQGVGNAVAWHSPGGEIGDCSTPCRPRRIRFRSPRVRHRQDGDLEEGVIQRGVRLAGPQELGNLDPDLGRQPDFHRGQYRVAFTEDVARALRAYNWHAQASNTAADGDVDVVALERAFTGRARNRPALVHPCCAPSSAGRRQQAKHRSGPRVGARRGRGPPPPRRFWASIPSCPLEVGEDVLAHAREVMARGVKLRTQNGLARFDAWDAANPEPGRYSERLLAALDFPAAGPRTYRPSDRETKGDSLSTRAASGKMLAALASPFQSSGVALPISPECNITAMAGEPSCLPAGIPPCGRAIPTDASCISEFANTPWARS